MITPFSRSLSLVLKSESSAKGKIVTKLNASHSQDWVQESVSQGMRLLLIPTQLNCMLNMKGTGEGTFIPDSLNCVLCNYGPRYLPYIT